MIGKTPILEYKINNFIHKFKIEKENYVPWEEYFGIGRRLEKKTINLHSIYSSLSFNNFSNDLKLYIDGVLLDSTKFANYKLLIGSHRIQLIDAKYDCEISKNINMEPDNHYEIYLDRNKFSLRPLIYSAIIPGLGQISNQYYQKGTLILLSTIASGCLTAWSINNHHRKTDEYNSFQDKYRLAKTEADASYYHSMTQNAYDKVNTASKLKSLAIGTMIGVYLYNLLDAVLFSGRLDLIRYEKQDGKYQIKNEIGYKSISAGIQWNF